MYKRHGCDLRLESFRAPRVCQDRAYILVQEAQNLDLELISEEQDLQEVLEKDNALEAVILSAISKLERDEEHRRGSSVAGAGGQGNQKSFGKWENRTRRKEDDQEASLAQSQHGMGQVAREQSNRSVRAPDRQPSRPEQ